MLNPLPKTVNGHEFWMIPVEGGRFQMGSPKDDVEALRYEKPRHEVTLGDFFIGKFPVTQGLWRAVATAPSEGVTKSHPLTSLKPSPSYFQGDSLPVEQVSWEDVKAFIQKLNNLTADTRPTGYSYRLPTEAEWEYAARGGKYHQEGYRYAGSDRLKDVGWFEGNNDVETKPVGLKKPNQLGLYDMSGNVWEWCEDDWHDNYDNAPKDGSAWVDTPNRGSDRVFRGGGWNDTARYCRAAYRPFYAPDYRYDSVGFRLALSLQSVGSPLPAFL
jgi:sulfatase modifying factor 1